MMGFVKRPIDTVSDLLVPSSALCKSIKSDLMSINYEIRHTMHNLRSPKTKSQAWTPEWMV